jgi:hypothetical protein
MLDEIEAEMKKIGNWPGADNYKSISIAFDRWVQKTFLPVCRGAILGNELPPETQFVLLEMLRRDAFHPTNPEAAHLLDLLSRFERLVESRRSAPPH